MVLNVLDILAVREMQMKTNLRFHFTGARMARIKTTGKHVDENKGMGTLSHFLMGLQLPADIKETGVKNSPKAKGGSTI